MRDLIHRAAVTAGAAVVVLGAGVSAAAAGTGPAVLAFRPAPFDYGQVTVHQKRAETFTLANIGGRASGALTVRLSGPAAFTITADACTATSLGPGKSCTVTVQFAPTATGTVTATLTAAGKNRAAAASDTLTGTGKGLGGTQGHIYWSNQSTGTISAAPLTGGIPTTWPAGRSTRPGWRWTPATSTGPTPAKQASPARSGRPRWPEVPDPPGQRAGQPGRGGGR